MPKKTTKKTTKIVDTPAVKPMKAANPAKIREEIRRRLKESGDIGTLNAQRMSREVAEDARKNPGKYQ